MELLKLGASEILHEPLSYNAGIIVFLILWLRLSVTNENTNRIYIYRDWSQGWSPGSAGCFVGGVPEKFRAAEIPTLINKTKCILHKFRAGRCCTSRSSPVHVVLHRFRRRLASRIYLDLGLLFPSAITRSMYCVSEKHTGLTTPLLLLLISMCHISGHILYLAWQVYSKQHESHLWCRLRTAVVYSKLILKTVYLFTWFKVRVQCTPSSLVPVVASISQYSDCSVSIMFFHYNESNWFAVVQHVHWWIPDCRHDQKECTS